MPFSFHSLLLIKEGKIEQTILKKIKKKIVSRKNNIFELNVWQQIQYAFKKWKKKTINKNQKFRTKKTGNIYFEVLCLFVI